MSLREFEGRFQLNRDEVLAKGPQTHEYPRGDKPLLALIQELAGRREAPRVHLEKDGLVLSLN